MLIWVTAGFGKMKNLLDWIGLDFGVENFYWIGLDWIVGLKIFTGLDWIGLPFQNPI